jgi:hypothetical protein
MTTTGAWSVRSGKTTKDRIFAEPDGIWVHCGCRSLRAALNTAFAACSVGKPARLRVDASGVLYPGVADWTLHVPAIANAIAVVIVK